MMGSPARTAARSPHSTQGTAQLGTPYYSQDGITLHEGDCLRLMRDMPDDSFDLIATDPPYFKVKGEAWDRQWDKPDQFIAWIGELCAEWQRILKPNGSLYVFASPRMAARVECAVGDRFNIVNSITWSKPGQCYAEKYGPQNFRGYVEMCERVIFAEHFNADNMAKGEAGYHAKCDELRGFVFEPLRAYLVGEFERAGMMNTKGKIAANVACGFSPSAGGMASRHYFSRSQWCLPTPEHYEAMRGLLCSSNCRTDYLRREYEDLRRPFTVTADVPYTDVWTFPTVNSYPGKHPCEKPLAMMEHIVRASSREGAKVLDCFVGSGVTAEACANLGRECVGIDLDLSHAMRRMDRLHNSEPLFQEAAA
jgi:adenine-specific DNA-methyltransferase